MDAFDVARCRAMAALIRDLVCNSDQVPIEASLRAKVEAGAGKKFKSKHGRLCLTNGSGVG